MEHRTQNTRTEMLEHRTLEPYNMRTLELEY